MDPITHLLTRGVDKIYPSREALEKVLRSGKKLTLYQGFDPTGTQLHIGHAVGFRKLHQWQELGHHVIFLIGDGTGQAGDPSGKKTAREKFFTTEELRKNGKDYVMQSGKIMDFDGPNPVEIRYNGDWLNKLGLTEILNIAGNFTLQQMLERDLYQERIKNNIPLSLREFMYPLLQGYDSVAMKVDLELGGSDQTFNMLAGRTLVKAILGKEKFVMTVPLLTDSQGRKIGKTEGNVIGITDEPKDFYGKIMSLGDDAIVNCFTLLTDMTDSDITHIQTAIKNGENPMVYKKQLAFELTKELNTEDDAKKAQQDFETRFQKGNVSKSALSAKSVTSFTSLASVSTVMMEAGLASSKSEAKRLIDQGAVKLNNTSIHEDKWATSPKANDVLQVGRKAIKLS